MLMGKVERLGISMFVKRAVAFSDLVELLGRLKSRHDVGVVAEGAFINIPLMRPKGSYGEGFLKAVGTVVHFDSPIIMARSGSGVLKSFIKLSHLPPPLDILGS